MIRTILSHWFFISAAIYVSTVAIGRSSDTRPNILLIVADDLGYTDLGVYGSEIQTQHIDDLAARGLLFTQFHTSPVCGPTRAMLLSGNNNHVAGVARQDGKGLLSEPIRGYENSLSKRIVPFPKLLQQAGYNTFATGKWHLGTEIENSPKAAGFTRSFNLLQGSGNYFNSIGTSEGGSLYSEDGNFVNYPDGSYATEVYTDRLIGFIDEHKTDEKPFFAFAAYTSPHWPLQLPEDWLDKYRGHYDIGYDELRKRRFEAAMAADVISKNSKLPLREDAAIAWEKLSSEERLIESRKMELYAALVENLDFHIGRLVQYLKNEALLENTVIVFLSDNGPDGGDYFNRRDQFKYLHKHYHNAYENMGKPSSFVTLGPNWAEASSAPFSRYKKWTREGGIMAPLIISGPGVDHVGSKSGAYVTVMDLAPTFLELGNARYPNDEHLSPMLGESMVGLLKATSDRVHSVDYVTTLYHGGRAYLRQGNWKLVNLDPPFDESKMELFDLEADPSEASDLAKIYPDRFKSMLELWRTERKKLGIILPQDL